MAQGLLPGRILDHRPDPLDRAGPGLLEEGPQLGQQVELGVDVPERGVEIVDGPPEQQVVQVVDQAVTPRDVDHLAGVARQMPVLDRAGGVEQGGVPASQNLATVVAKAVHVGQLGLGDLLSIGAQAGPDIADRQALDLGGDDGATLVGQLAENPEIQEHHAVFRQEQDVAGVRVAMEEAVDEQLLQRRLGEVVQGGGQVEARELLGQLLGRAGLDELANVRRADPGHEVHGQHPGGRQVPVDRRNDHGGAGLARHAFGRRALYAEVHLPQRPRLELVDHAGGRQSPEHAQRLGEGGQLAQVADVGPEDPHDAGTLDLHRHPAPVGQARVVDLADRRRRDRFGAEGREQGLDRCSQLAFNNPLGHARRHRRDALEQIVQLKADLRWENVEAQS